MQCGPCWLKLCCATCLSPVEEYFGLHSESRSALWVMPTALHIALQLASLSLSRLAPSSRARFFSRLAPHCCGFRPWAILFRLPGPAVQPVGLDLRCLIGTVATLASRLDTRVALALLQPYTRSLLSPMPCGNPMSGTPSGATVIPDSLSDRHRNRSAAVSLRTRCYRQNHRLIRTLAPQTRTLVFKHPEGP